MISDFMESPLAIEYQPGSYRQAASYQKLVDVPPYSQRFTSEPENGRSQSEGNKIHMIVSLANWTVLKIKSGLSRGGQNWTIFVTKLEGLKETNLGGLQELMWMVRRTGSDHENLQPYRSRMHL